MSKSKALIQKITIPIVILSVFLVAALFTAVILRHVSKENDTYRRVRASRDTEEQVWSDWYYNDVKYSVAPGLTAWNTFIEEYTEENGFYLISWNWYIPILKKVYMFGDSVDDPHYLFCPYFGDRHCVRVSENFDYMNEEYIIYQEDSQGERIQPDTELSFKLKDVYYPDKSIKRDYNNEPIAAFYSISKSFERLAFEGYILLADGEYYINFQWNSTLDTEQTYKAKPEFIELMKEAGILS